MSRSRDVSAVQNNLGVAIPPAAAGKNAVINGGFDIWQRGTSISVTANTPTYVADRWQVNNGANEAMTVARQSTSDTTNLPNIQYCARVQRNSGQTGTSNITFVQSFETVNSIPYAGKTVTLSFYARAGSNFSSTSNVLNCYIITGTGTDQNRCTAAYTGDDLTITAAKTLTTTWQRFTLTGTIPTTATEMAVLFYYTPTGTASTNDYFEVTGVQVELGSSATPFSRAGGTIQGELAACQRYYQRWANSQSGPFANTSELCVAEIRNTTTAYAVIPTMTVMRGSPTVGLSAASTFSINSAGKSGAAAGVAANTTSYYPISLAFTLSGYTAGQAGWLYISSGGYVEAIAEL